MCKNAYEKLSDKSGKVMIFCSLRGMDGTLAQACVAQRYCNKKDKYIENDNPRKNCKYYM